MMKAISLYRQNTCRNKKAKAKRDTTRKGRERVTREKKNVIPYEKMHTLYKRKEEDGHEGSDPYMDDWERRRGEKNTLGAEQTVLDLPNSSA